PGRSLARRGPGCAEHASRRFPSLRKSRSLLFSLRGSLRERARLPKQKARSWTGPFVFVLRDAGGLRRLVLDHGVLGLVGGAGLGRLRPAARALGERGLDLLHGLGLGAALHRRDLARQTIERGLVELTLGVALLRLRIGAIEVAHDLGDRDDIARV